MDQHEDILFNIKFKIFYLKGDFLTLLFWISSLTSSYFFLIFKEIYKPVTSKAKEEG